MRLEYDEYGRAFLVFCSMTFLITIYLLRTGVKKEINLIPEKWEGQGLIGCSFAPLLPCMKVQVVQTGSPAEGNLQLKSRIVQPIGCDLIAQRLT